MAKEMTDEEIQNILRQIGEKALKASRALALLSPESKNKCLLHMADAIEESAKEIKTAIRKI